MTGLAAARPIEVPVLFQALPSPVFAIDADNRIVAANAAAEDFFATSASTLCRLRLDEVVPFSSPLFGAVQHLRETGTSLNEYGITIGTPRTGGERSVDIQAARLHEVPGAVVIVILQRSVAEAFDRQLSSRHAARTASGMASMLAHEIKNPLSGIRGAAQLIEPGLSDDDRPLAKLICAEADRIRDLVDQMEVFSDERPLVKSPVNIHAVLDHVKTLARTGFARAIPIREQYDPSLPEIAGNRDQLVQVFLNLVKNSAEAIETNGRDGVITLTTAFRPGIRIAIPGAGERISLPLEVAVHDTGPGIAADLMPHLFDAFVTSKSSGRGLGLALVAKIVRDHGGVVDCASANGRTVFRVLLPLSTPEEAGPR